MKTLAIDTILSVNEDFNVVFGPECRAVLHKEVLQEIVSLRDKFPYSASFMVAGGYFRDQVIGLNKVSDVDIFVDDDLIVLPEETGYDFPQSLSRYGTLVTVSAGRKGVFNLVVDNTDLRQKYNDFSLEVSKFAVVLDIVSQYELQVIYIWGDGCSDVQTKTLTCLNEEPTPKLVTYLEKIRSRECFHGWNVNINNSYHFYNDMELVPELPTFEDDLIYTLYSETMAITSAVLKDGEIKSMRANVLINYATILAYFDGVRGIDLYPYVKVKYYKMMAPYTPKDITLEEINTGWDFAHHLSPQAAKLFGEKKYTLALLQHPNPLVQMRVLGFKGLLNVNYTRFSHNENLVGAKPKACEGLNDPSEWYNTALWSKYLGLAAKDLSKYWKQHYKILPCGVIPNSHATQVARDEKLLNALTIFGFTPDWIQGVSAKQCILNKLKDTFPQLNPAEVLENPSILKVLDVMKELGTPAKYQHKIVGKKVTENGWTLEVLPKDSPVNLYIGELTSCCQHIHGAAREVCKRGWTDPHSINYVIKSPSGSIMAHFWTWVAKDGRIVIDSIEGRRSVPCKEVAQLISLFAREYNFSQVLVSKTNYGLTQEVLHLLGLKREVSTCEVEIRTRYTSYTPDAYDNGSIWVFE